MQNGLRTRNIFNPDSREPFKLSRSKLELFTECPRCFYLDRRLGVGRPSGPSFTLNSAVDFLLKKEFDVHRARGSRHPLMEHYGVKAVPYPSDRIDEWRDNFRGVQFFHRPTNFVVTGAVDDVWLDDDKETLIVVDYKATSTIGGVDINSEWRASYKRQMEIYQWLLRRNGFKVSDIGYFVYANGDKDKAAFDGKLEFKVEIIPYKGNDAWVEEAVVAARECLSGKLPPPGEKCEYCSYRGAAAKYEMGDVE
ncbi:MAG TPA: PD-(D/E)XK nuclease family protein [Candidatus Paceibacterota bacterium]|nr:PD-(D/E)XK nuclease family protein [Candidatus Paceibacterota bacterium]